MSLGIERTSAVPVQPVPTSLVSTEAKQVPVTVSGQDLSGIAFVDNCNTIAIARNGAVVPLVRALGADQELYIRYGARERLVRVIRHSEPGIYELCFLKSEPQFWGSALNTFAKTDF
jgi:hypothetical protein